MPLTDAEKAGIIQHLEYGCAIDRIAFTMALPRSNVRAVVQQYRKAFKRPEPAAVPGTSTLRCAAPRPLDVHVPPPVLAAASNKGVLTALLYGDTHIPYQDERTLSIVRQIVTMLQPSLLVNMGDLLDCYSISRFDKDPQRTETLQDEIDAARVHLAQMRQLSPQSRVVLLEGNHEDRLRRLLWGLKGEAAVLAKLTAFNQVITWPKLLDLDGLGVEFVPYGKHSQFSFLPKFLLKHGDRISQYSAYTAAAELRHHNKSGASGHTHRLGVYHRNEYVWVETGCTCTTTPDYVADPNWQNGCVVLSFDQATGAVAVESVEIRNGLAMFRGTALRAT